MFQAEGGARVEAQKPGTALSIWGPAGSTYQEMSELVRDGKKAELMKKLA